MPLAIETVAALGFASVGLCLGSFGNVVIARWPKQQSLSRPGSHCPGCGAPIRWWQNIPLLSFALLRGRCGACRERISWRYPLVEALAAALALAALWHFGLGWRAAGVALLSIGLLIGSIIDLEHYLLPDEITLGGAALGLGFALLPGGPTLLDAAAGAAAGAGLLGTVALGYEKIAKREGMGMGDVKLMACLGAWGGFKILLPIFALAPVAGLLYAGAVAAAGRLSGGFRGEAMIPFGPFLAGAALFTIYWGERLLYPLFYH